MGAVQIALSKGNAVLFPIIISNKPPACAGYQFMYGREKLAGEEVAAGMLLESVMFAAEAASLQRPSYTLKNTRGILKTL